MIHAISANKLDDESQSIDALDLLESYECWQPFTELINGFIKDPKRRKLIYYVRLARMQNQYTDDIFSAAETCSRAVRDLKLSFERFTQVLREVLTEDDWSSEAVILQSTSSKFSDLKDKIDCFERMALLYEKKTHDSDELRNTFEKLLQIDAYNIKALRYYKLVFTQNGEWNEAVSVMQKLLDASKHPQDVYRLAQEMASVYLYHLDKPKQAIETIETYCADSPLDTSMIHYDAYERMGDLDSCIKVIKSCLPKVDSKYNKAVLLFKAGLLEERKNNADDAIGWYKKAIESADHFLEPYEKIAGIHARREAWKELEGTLVAFKSQLKNKEIIENIDGLIDRIHSVVGKS